MSAEIKFLHLSDIHYMSNPDSRAIRFELLKEIEKNFCEQIDCIILTGDFFQQGKYEKDNGDVLDFVKEICKKCLKPNYLPNGYNENEWKRHVFFCPGNHDLERNVSCCDENNKKIISRTSVLKAAQKNNPDNINKNSDVNYECLVKKSFELFDEIISRSIGIEQGYGEYQVFKEQIIDTKKMTHYDVFFVGINTALYAGQERGKDEIRTEIAKATNELMEEKRKYFPDCKKAEEKFETFLKLHNELINGGVKDENKLCFISQQSEDEIKCKINGNVAHFVVFFGHHPLEFLTQSAQKEFATWAKELSEENRCIYLCGHEHKPKALEHTVQLQGTGRMHFTELEVGGNFADETEWNSLSFAVYTLKIDDSFKAILNGEIACWNKGIEEISDTLLHEQIYGWQYYNLKEISINLSGYSKHSTQTSSPPAIDKNLPPDLKPPPTNSINIQSVKTEWEKNNILDKLVNMSKLY